MRAFVLGSILLAACGGDDTYLVVTVDKREAVHNAETLKVTLTNSGEMLTKSLPIKDAMFPMTFSLSAPGRSGDLVIDIDAVDADEALVGRGTGSTTVDEMAASVTLDSADFVVNDQVASDQYLTIDYEAVGFQLAALTDNTWTATYMQDCTMCDVFARRFDATGLPITSEAAASNLSFNVASKQTTGGASGAIPAVASSGTDTLAFWDFTDVGSSPGRGVACRQIMSNGAISGAQTPISTDSADVVSATGMPNGNFAVAWQVLGSPSVVRGAIVTKDCSFATLGPQMAFPVSSDGAVSAHRPHVAANGSTLLYAWVVDDATAGGLRIRTASLNGAFTGAEITLVANTATQTIEHVRVVPWDTGFAIAVRWITPSSQDGPGKIEVYRTNAAGQLQGTPVLITDQSRSDYQSNWGFSVAQRPDHALLVAWHVCQAGAGLCDVFGRILRPTGAPVGDAFMIPTSTASEQVNPSVIALQDSFVAAWNDSSGEAPDRSGTAVRARILYPVYDDARGVHGATCGASSPGSPTCDDGLACAMGSDGVQRCYAKCTPPSCPGGGTCSTVDETTSACTF